MGERKPPQAIELGKEIKSYQELVDFLTKLVPPGSFFKVDGTVLKVSIEAAFTPTLEDIARSLWISLNKNSNFKRTDSLTRRAGSNIFLEADLVKPVGEINKVEFHLNKDM